jgi:HAD superfamily hydrolase (TIGR01509 family)
VSRQPVAALVLDFDGLIVDTETPIFEEWRAEYAARGHELRLEDWQHALGTNGGFDPGGHLAALTNGALDVDDVRGRVRDRSRLRCEAQPLLPGVRELLLEGKRLGLRSAVASSSSAGWVEGWLVRHRIRGLVQAVCARDHVARVKPAPDLFLLAAERLGVPPASCLVFEDSPNGIRAARAAGMRCVAVPNAITRRLPLPDPDLVVGSLAETPLGVILDRLGLAPQGALPASP